MIDYSIFAPARPTLAALFIALFANHAIAAPVCSVSQATQERILKTLCSNPGATPNPACITHDAESSIVEAIAYITLFERCGDRAFADQAARGLSRVYAATAALASCVGVDLDSEAMIAYGRARAKTNSSNLTCTANSETVLKGLRPNIAKYADVAADPNSLLSLYEAAGVSIDAAGKVTEK
ncbi:MAG: hypothetical protein J0I16_17145 [Rhizobiales bacterium]|nr:hypothetical protein [Hyphomicrobiales bacterium]